LDTTVTLLMDMARAARIAFVIICLHPVLYTGLECGDMEKWIRRLPRQWIGATLIEFGNMRLPCMPGVPLLTSYVHVIIL